MLYLNPALALYFCSTGGNLTLTSVVFESKKYVYKKIKYGNLTLTSVVFEWKIDELRWFPTEYLTLTSVVFELGA